MGPWDACSAKVKALARSHQVLVVTHLPQVAACADRHVVVSKKTDGKQSQTHIQPLERKEQVLELARMLGGAASEKAAPTQTALKHAEELLEESRQ